MIYYLYRAAYEQPMTGERKRFTFASNDANALRWAAEYVKKGSNGYLLSIVEVRPLLPILELT